MSSVVYQSDYVPTNFNRGVLRASIVLPGHLVCYGFVVYTTNAAGQKICVFDQAALPGNGAVPLFVITIAANSEKGVSWAPQGREFSQGLTIANSSTDTSLTIGSADCYFDVQYDLISDGGTVVSAEN